MTIIGPRILRTITPHVLEPFRERYEEAGLSGGLSRAGYDVAVEFDREGIVNEVFLSPGEFILASTAERFRMPNNLLGVVHDKSTLARRGLAVQNTVIEPGWCGWLTLELTNHGNFPLPLYRGQPIAQVLFHEVQGAEPYEGKYQDQPRGPQAARST